MERTVLVTGGRGGLGPAVTEAFLADGWRVVTPLRRRPEPGGAEPAPGGGRLEVVEADLVDPAAVERAAAHAAAGPAAPLRAVVNLAGGYAAGPRLHETPPEEFERLLALNLRPTFLVTRAALPHLLAAGGGAVVCVSARAALQPFAGAVPYATAKAAVLAFAQAVAVEYRASGVRCNAILPSVIDTPANRAAQPDADHARWVPPAQVAAVIRFLAGEESAPTSGAAVPVYGRA
jgi:NAD(P)-dependent dehydrogenase (short-subunit alcohol dehydrogenase family)